MLWEDETARQDWGWEEDYFAKQETAPACNAQLWPLLPVFVSVHKDLAEVGKGTP